MKFNESAKNQVFDSTGESNMFATLRTYEENLPAGNSATLCINFLWNTLDLKSVTDQYKQLENMPECEDGTPGIEVHIWHEEAIVSNAFSCKMKQGVFKVYPD
jgi:hypothetical protein